MSSNLGTSLSLTRTPARLKDDVKKEKEKHNLVYDHMGHKHLLICALLHSLAWPYPSMSNFHNKQHQPNG